MLTDKSKKVVHIVSERLAFSIKLQRRNQNENPCIHFVTVVGGICYHSSQRQRSIIQWLFRQANCTKAWTSPVPRRAIQDRVAVISSQDKRARVRDGGSPVIGWRPDILNVDHIGDSSEHYTF